MTRVCLRASLLFASVVSVTFASRVDAQRLPTFRIMMIADGESEPLSRRQEMLKNEILELASDDVNVEFLEPKGKPNWSVDESEAAVRAALANPAVDMVIVSGAMTGVAVGRIPKLRKPVLIPFAAPELQGLPRVDDRSGKRNLAYIAGLLNFEAKIRRLRDIVRFDRMAFIVGEEVVRHLDAPEQPIQKASRRVGIESKLVVADPDARATLDAIPKQAEAVYIGPLARWTDDQMQELIDGLNQRGLPSYAGDGLKWVERGALTTMETYEDEVRRMRRAALFVQRILTGEPASTLPVSFEQRPVLVINMATARAIGTWPRFEIMAEARLINDQSGTRGPLMTLETVMRDAVRANLDLMAEGLRIDASYQGIKVARGSWLLGLRADGDMTVTDPSIANSLGQAQYQFTWSGTASQLLYSPSAHAELRFRRSIYWSVEHDYQSVRLDTMLAAGEAYLDVLRAKNNESVNRDNLRLTRKNLALAETRNAIGVAGREEVYRWQTQIAESRSGVIEASAIRNQTEIALNRILNRPLEGPFRVPPPEEIRTVLPGSDTRLAKYFEDPWSFKVFRQFMALEAIRNSPEIRSLDNTITARDEVLKGERRQLGIPDISAVGGFQHIPYLGGVGSQPAASDPSSPIPAGTFPSRQTFTWTVGAQASLTLLDGGTNYARIRRQFREIDTLQTERAALVLALEERVRASLHQAGFSFANIALTADAAEASALNLELVTDLYRSGATNIIQLIDAQNQALSAKLAAANARYDFLIDALRVQRASGAFSLEGTEEERDDFIQRLDDFASKRNRFQPVTEPPERPKPINKREIN